MSDFHIVKKGDNLTKIAKQYGTNTTTLRKLNDLPDPNKLDIGQKIALRKEAVCGVDALFLDADRNPIKGLEYFFDFCGKTIKGVTGEDGKAKKVMTDSPTDQVRILVKRFDGTLKEITTVMSGYRNKLVTLISPLLVIDTELKPHPNHTPGERPNPKDPIKPAFDPKKKPLPTTDKKELGPKTRQTATPDGKPVTVVEGDIPGLDFLGGYTGEKITEDDYEAAAKELGCEVEVIKAIGKQETGTLERLGLGAFDKFNRPTILYERHIFSDVTGGAYDDKYPDISSKKRYLAGTARSKNGKQFDDGGHYGWFSWQYRKLAKAYQLDTEAAIQACSWGKFQVLGKNYKLCGFSSAFDFAKAMCKSELEHLNVMVSFCKGNNLKVALKKRDWATIAKVYNGPQYKKHNYDKNLEDHYNFFNESGN